MAGPRDNPGARDCVPRSTHSPPKLDQEIRDLWDALCRLKGQVGRIGLAGPAGPAGEPGPIGPVGPQGAGGGTSIRFFHHQVDWKVIGPPLGFGEWDSTLFFVEPGRAFTVLWMQGTCICVNNLGGCPDINKRWRVSIKNASNALLSWPMNCPPPDAEYLYWFNTPGGMGQAFVPEVSSESGHKYFGGGVGINAAWPYGVPFLTRANVAPIEVVLNCQMMCPPPGTAAPHTSFILQGAYLVTNEPVLGALQVAEQFGLSCIFPGCPPFPVT